jgi:oxygen-independent coproporphyrinogen III oxidase
MPVGLYVSVPFCKTKCSYCNFASDVFSKAAYQNYVRRLIEDVNGARKLASNLGCALDDAADSIYLGGGTPSILDGEQLRRVFSALRGEFAITPGAEITVECAPGTITPALIEILLRCGVNRVSLGVQSFVDREAQAVGRLHKRGVVIEEIGRLRAEGIVDINVDLIAGLPHQTAESWRYSVEEAIATGVPHVSVYMLEVDNDSRLGRELIAGGTRYHAHFVPDDGATADFYLAACDFLERAGISQYEISNFAKTAGESSHNLKYWTRRPYIGFGVDAHSMVETRTAAASAVKAVSEEADNTRAPKRSTAAIQEQACCRPGCYAAQSESLIAGECRAVRFATPDSLDAYMNRKPHEVMRVSSRAALEEEFFLGLRLNRGIELEAIRAKFGQDAINAAVPAIDECLRDGLLEQPNETLRLTARGRLFSNEVFARFIGGGPQEVKWEPVTG